jgi:type I restriction enzyme S subunit
MGNQQQWEKVRLGDIITIKHGWPFKSEYICEELTGRPIVVNIGNFAYTGGFRFETTRTREYRGNYPQEYELKPDDILLVMTCQTSEGEILGVPARVPDDGQVYLHNQRLGKVIVTRPDKVEPDYLYWLFLWHEFNHELYVTASGTKILHTAPKRIEGFEFNLPSLGEQRAIAKILYSLENKIGLNKTMNATLEKIAVSVFKRWFVDFEFPNEEGKPYKSTNGKVIDSILKIIPDGWRTGKLDQIADLLMGISPEGASYNDAGVGMPLLNGAADFQGSVIIPRKWTKTPIKICKKGSLLFCIRATIGNLVFADREYCLGRGVAALNPKNVAFTEFIYYILQQSLKELTSKASGSVILGLSKSDIEELPVTIPDNETLTRFHEICSVLFGKITNQSQNSLTLASIRDCLLPRLMSGKIRVPVPQETVEA